MVLFNYAQSLAYCPSFSYEVPPAVSGFVSVIGGNSLEVYSVSGGDVGVYNFDITVKIDNLLDQLKLTLKISKIAEIIAPLIIYQ